MTRLLRLFGAITALAVVLVGIPMLLINIAGWPLPTKIPDWSNAARMMQQGNIEGTTVLKVLACVVWAAWLVVAWAIVWEAVVNVPRMISGRRHQPTPLAPAAVSKGVGWLFTVLLATTVVSQPAHAAPSLGSFADTDDRAATELSIESPDLSTSRASGSESERYDDEVDDSVEVWVVGEDDTLWSIAQTTGVSVEQILELNTGLTSTSMLDTGAQIHVPAGTEVPDTRRTQSPQRQNFSSENVVSPEAATPTAATYVVRENDGMWNVAEALLGDGSRHVEMAELAIGQQVAPDVTFTADTFTIHPGWVFTLPTATTPTPASAVTAVESDTYVVVTDDSLSAIAEAELGSQDRWVDLWELNGGQQMSDGTVFDDPNLIRPGWELQLIPVADVPAEADVPAVADVPVEVDNTTVADVPVEVDDTAVVDVPVEVEAPVEVERVLPPPAFPISPSATDSQPPVPTAPPATQIDTADSVDEVDVIAGNWQRSVWAEIAAGSLLLAGLGMMVRRLRFRRLARLEPGQRLVDPPSVAAGTELAVTRTPDAMNDVATLRGLLQSITPYASEQADPPPVRAVQIGEERVEVLFATPAPLPPKGWTTVDGGQSWTHRFEDDAVTSRQLLTPALVTIGIRQDENGDEVLLDLETAGSVAIGGDHEAALGLARSMALELATYPLGVPMDLRLIGLHVDGTETCDRVWLDTTLQRAVRVTRQRLESNGVQGATSMVAARAALDEDDGAHDPVVFIVNAAAVSVSDRALLDELIDITHPSTGVAVVLVGEHLNAHEHIDIDSNSQAVWSQVRLSAPNVTLEAAAEAAVMLDHAANAESEAMEPGELMVALLELTDIADAETGQEHSDNELDEDDVDEDQDTVAEYEYEPPAHDILLQVMGSVTTHGIDMTANEVELLAFMACLRDHSNVHVDLIHDALAPNTIRKTVENRISKLRVRLGVGSDDCDLLPAATSPVRGATGTYRLSNLVVTDVDLLEHRLHTAHSLGSTDALRVLRDGLDLMHGPLFRSRKGFDGWPHSEGIVVAMTSVITNYACRLIDLAVEVDDIALVVRTTAAAGRVLDNPVAEFPFRQAEEEYAALCGDEKLVASVTSAQQRLLSYLQNYDSLAEP